MEFKILLKWLIPAAFLSGFLGLLWGFILPMPYSGIAAFLTGIPIGLVAARFAIEEADRKYYRS